jgi:hypothetical protein
MLWPRVYDQIDATSPDDTAAYTAAMSPIAESVVSAYFAGIFYASLNTTNHRPAWLQVCCHKPTGE